MFSLIGIPSRQHLFCSLKKISSNAICAIEETTTSLFRFIGYVYVLGEYATYFRNAYIIFIKYFNNISSVIVALWMFNSRYRRYYPVNSILEMFMFTIVCKHLKWHFQTPFLLESYFKGSLQASSDLIRVLY